MWRKQIQEIHFLEDISGYCEVHEVAAVAVPRRARHSAVFFELFRLPLRYGSNLPVRRTSEEEQSALAEVARNSHESWDSQASLYYAAPCEELTQICARLFSGCLVIGYDFSPLCKKALSSAGVAWISAVEYPARFMPELYWAFSSNIKDCMEYFYAWAIPSSAAHLAAGQQIARYTPNHMAQHNWLYPNSALLLGRGELDPPAIDQDGRRLSLCNYAQELAGLRKNHSVLYAMQLQDKRERRFLEEKLGAIVIEPPKFFARSLYPILAHPHILTVAGVNTRALYEASFFEKEVVRFRPDHLHFPSLSNHCFNVEVELALPVPSHCMAPKFWRDLLAPQSDVGGYAGSVHDPLPNLRLLLRGGGSDFDDAQSFTHCLELGHLTFTDQLLKFSMSMRETGLGSGFKLPAAPPMPPKPPDAQSRYAIFSNGDEKVVIQAIVALHSLKRYLGTDDLFYITDQECLDEKARELLASFGVTVLHTKYPRLFCVNYRNTAAHAYTQLVGPEVLLEHGYAYSIGVQTDILCVRAFDPWVEFARTAFFSATKNPFMEMSYGVKKKRRGLPYSPEWRRLHAPGLIPDVLFCNNEALADMEFSRLAAEMFTRLGAENLLMNEESLLHYLTLENPRLCVYSEVYSAGTYSTHRDNAPTFLHFDNGQKPWCSLPVDSEASWSILCEVWHRAARDILGARIYEDFVQAYSIDL